MSLSLNFEPHSWYMDFAIEKTGIHKLDITNWPWNAYTDDGNTYQIIQLHASTLSNLKKQIKAYHYKVQQRQLLKLEHGI